MKSVLRLRQSNHCAYLTKAVKSSKSKFYQLHRSAVCPSKCTRCAAQHRINSYSNERDGILAVLTANYLVHLLAHRNRFRPFDNSDTERLSQLFSFYKKLNRHVLSHAMTHQSITLPLGRVPLQLVVV